MKMKTKLSVIFISLFLVIFTASSLVGYFNAKTIMQNSVNTYLKGEAERISRDIDEWLDKKLMAVTTVANLVEDENILEKVMNDPTNNSFLQATGYDEGLIHYYMAMEDKTFISGSGWLPPDDYNPTQRPWYQKVKEYNQPIFTEAYLDLNSEKISVSAVAPINGNDGTFLGAVSTDIYLETLTELIINTKFANNGYAFLFAEDGTMLAHPDEELVYTNLKDSEKFATMYEKIVDVEEGFEEYTDKNIKKIMVYSEVPSTQWKFGIVMDKDLAFQPLKTLIYEYMLILLLGIVVIVLISIMTSKKIAKPIIELSKIIEKLSCYDLALNQEKQILKGYVKRKDEIGMITKALFKMQQNFTELIQNISVSSQQVASSSQELTATSHQSSVSTGEIAQTIEEIANGASEQAKDTENVVREIETMSQLITKEKNHIHELSQSTQWVNQCKDEGMQAVHQLIEKSKENNKIVEEILEIVTTTNDEAKKIQSASQMIKNIADQTNLLALNAAIEAARAGESGRGFAVVANEIRQLAEQSDAFAEKIIKVIEALSSKTQTGVIKMQEAGKIVADQTQSVNTTDEKYKQIAKAVEGMKTMLITLDTSSKEMEDKKNTIIRIVENLSSIAEENAAGTEETSASVEEQTASMEQIASASEGLAKLAEKMNHHIATFKY
jgi:methyl-accepting chemotaxis protein